jgi:hypothetical protein
VRVNDLALWCAAARMFGRTPAWFEGLAPDERLAVIAFLDAS